ncbi:hypoxanthine phosphoribosyltransferase [Loigolactobacillus backii]|uniref:Hypoxanthine phosphoribosyltransferase n=1 Tax=Loigolactobacillus backii TaxID=375175 RepID=A0A192H032_9LACO|nr:hypoxanthine phosphoribosyltransferase [Loigolactobacillus backii]ANK59005.1 hypoxanthine phosphoribosyltransferase [Loigolactobacillus backii]ANK61326.1 hypoxanthine phosphoribosyltransferase [Loigolactobacillus backii]ANK63993.1 hypoxanthine phosphoribosyltransferase [Loigolactobacillus backii]ANK66442.1 hypoxanthine phosphoribosyltransferase [Loigolactobacillus backii]ANK69474.1 hypoxanthine phosphoribosyltransferase [Loigolactobacillus backii]
MHQDIEQVLYDQKALTEVTKSLGAQLTVDYAGKNPLVVCVLKGAILFMADLVRQIDTHVELDFMDVSSYGGATVSSGEVKIVKDLDTSVENRDVLIVEDIVDTGRTLNYIADLFKYRKAKSVKICTLLDKPETRVVPVHVDYSGFKVPNAFLVGYGLDYAEHYRNLPYIGILKSSVYQTK